MVMKIKVSKNASGFGVFISGGVVSGVVSIIYVEVERFEPLDRKYCW